MAEFKFTPITLDTSVLSAFYSSKLAISAAQSKSAATTAKPASQRGPAVVPPWQQGLKAGTVEGRYNALKGLSKFIDLNADAVKGAQGDADYKALFAVFNGLRHMRTLAEYAVRDNTPDGILSGIDARFQTGLKEFRSFLETVPLNRATLLFGEKSDTAKSFAALGEDAKAYVGRVAQVGAREDPIAGLSGTETFSISIAKSLETETFTIDLSQVTGGLTIDNVVNYANSIIHAPETTDSEGNTIQKYTSRLAVEEVGTNLYAIKIVPSLVEKVSLGAPNAAPAVYISGTSKPTASGAVSSGFLAKIDDLASGDPASAFKTAIAALAPGETALQQAAKTGEKPTPVLAETVASATAVDSNGHIYVLGTTKGDMDSQINRSAAQDVYLSKYDSVGSLLWRRLVGATTESSAGAIAVDASDNVVIAGYTPDNLETTALIDSVDSFVTKYSSAGEALWTHQVQAVADDRALSLAIDASGDVYFGGQVTGAIDAAATHQGGSDSFVVKLAGATGAASATQQFGTAGADKATGLAVAADGDIIVAGTENGRAIVRKLSAADLSSTVWSIDLGDIEGGAITGVKVGADGSIYLSGHTANAALTGGAASVVGAHGGDIDGFALKIADSGASASADWIAYTGGAGTDRALSLDVSGSKVYLAGDTTGALAGENQVGSRDAFAIELDAASGARQWAHQFGAAGTNGATGIVVDPSGSSVLSKLGLASGDVNGSQSRTVVSQTSARTGDFFYVSVNGGNKTKIAIEKDDTFISLASKIKRASFLYIDSYSDITGDDGDKLVIKALRGGSISISPGDEGRDALKALGLEAGKIVSDATLGGSSTKKEGEEEASLTFGLGFSNAMSLRDKKAAKAALLHIDRIISNVQAAYRKLNPDPLIEALKKRNAQVKGPVPAQISKELSNYQAALFRLTGGQ